MSGSEFLNRHSWKSWGNGAVPRGCPPPRRRRNFTDEARGGGQRPYSPTFTVEECRTFTVHDDIHDAGHTHVYHTGLFLPFPNKSLFNAEILENAGDHRIHEILDGLGFMIKSGAGGQDRRACLGELGHIS